MRRILSIICIIFLIGITSAVPYYSTSYFVYAEENNEQLTDDEIINAGLSVYLNARNGFITIADGTLSGAKLLMNNTVESFINFYNANQTVENRISKSSLVGNILVNYNPFRVSLKGFAVNFFNNLYDYLEDNDKVPNASTSSGGITSDNLYQGYQFGGVLFTVYDSQYRGSVGGISTFTIPSDHVQLGNYVDGFFGENIYNIYRLSRPNWDINNANSYGGAVTHYVNYASDRSVKFFIQGNPPRGDYNGLFGLTGKRFIGYNDLIPVYTEDGSYNGGCFYTHDVREAGNVFHTSVVSCNELTGYFYFYHISNSITLNNAVPESIDFETDNFVSDPLEVPEGDDELELTPKDKDTGNTYNTYNEYINNYVIKKTYITNNNNGGGSNNDPYPLDPENPSDPGGTVPDWTGNSDSGTITPDGNGGYTFQLPDFSLPDLDINWSISGLSEKFPFSIPFDLYALFTVLNAEPETPEIHGEIPIWTYTWEIDWDLHQFDSIAALMRNLEFIAFCIGLAIITRNIIRG